MCQFRQKCSSVWANNPWIQNPWIQWVKEDSIKAIQNPEIESHQVKEISNDDGSNDKINVLEQENMGFKEIITMLDKMKRCSVFDDETQDMLPTITKRLEDLQLENRKQTSIKAYFNISL